MNRIAEFTSLVAVASLLAMPMATAQVDDLDLGDAVPTTSKPTAPRALAPSSDLAPTAYEADGAPWAYDAKGPRKLVTKRAKWNTVAADPESAKLNNKDGELSHRIYELAMKYKAATDEEQRAETENQIAEAVAQQFAIRQELREKQLTVLEAQVQRLRTVQTQRARQKDRIVADRVQQLIREAEGLGWGDAGAPTGGWSDYTPLSSLRRKAPLEVYVDEAHSILSGAVEPPVSEEGAPVR